MRTVMKYKAINDNKEKTLVINRLDGGINREASVYDIKNNELADGRNVYFDGKALRVRPGLSATAEDIIKIENDVFLESAEFFATETELFAGGEYKRIACEKAFDGISNYVYNIFLVGADGKSQNAGSLYFSRVSNDTFFAPESILFFTGAPRGGGGIFAFVTATNIYDTSQKSYRVYEINSQMTEWERKTSFYVPVVMINGRGNRYEYAKAVNSPFKATPRVLEARNLLTSRFKAYFTSDGYSTLFRLPYTGLADEMVVCRIYTGLTTYTEWMIYPNTDSVTESFFSAQITMHVDRSKGTVYFTGADGTDYPVPLISRYGENNICITAGKEFEGELDEACSLTCCCMCGSHIIFSGGMKPGRVYSVSCENPLYFSEKSVVLTGDGSSAVTALLKTENGVIAFKQNEILRLKLKTGEALGDGSLLADDDSVFYGYDSFTVHRLGDEGCESKRACTLCGASPVWLSGNGRIYTMNTGTGKITELVAAGRLARSLGKAEIKSAVAIGTDGYAAFLFEKTALVIKKPAEPQSAECFLWSFEAPRVKDAVLCGGNFRFFCVGADGKAFYTAAPVTQSVDTDISAPNGEPVIESVPVASEFTTKAFGFGGLALKKHIRHITLAAAPEGMLSVRLLADGECACETLLPKSHSSGSSLDVIRIVPHMADVKSLALNIRSESGFEMGEISFDYSVSPLR